MASPLTDWQRFRFRSYRNVVHDGVGQDMFFKAAYPTWTYARRQKEAVKWFEVWKQYDADQQLEPLPLVTQRVTLDDDGDSYVAYDPDASDYARFRYAKYNGVGQDKHFKAAYPNWSLAKRTELAKRWFAEWCTYDEGMQLIPLPIWTREPRSPEMARKHNRLDAALRKTPIIPEVNETPLTENTSSSNVSSSPPPVTTPSSNSYSEEVQQITQEVGKADRLYNKMRKEYPADITRRFILAQPMEEIERLLLLDNYADIDISVSNAKTSSSSPVVTTSKASLPPPVTPAKPPVKVAASSKESLNQDSTRQLEELTLQASEITENTSSSNVSSSPPPVTTPSSR